MELANPSRHPGRPSEPRPRARAMLSLGGPRQSGFRSAQNRCWPMKKNETGTKESQAKPSRTRPKAATRAQIHPVVIYPFRQPGHYSDLEELYQLIARLDEDKETYARAITVVDRKTHYSMEANKAFLDFRKDIVA